MGEAAFETCGAPLSLDELVGPQEHVAAVDGNAGQVERRFDHQRCGEGRIAAVGIAPATVGVLVFGQPAQTAGKQFGQLTADQLARVPTIFQRGAFGGVSST